MTRNELNEMTVLALRKLAKENRIVLGAGIDKAGIIEKLAPIVCDDAAPEAEQKIEQETEQDQLAEPKYQVKTKKYTGESSVVSMRMPKDMLREIDTVAAKTGRTRNEFMLMSLEFALDHLEIE